MLVLTATTPTGAVSASSERSGGAAGGPWLSTSQVGWEVTDPLAHLLEMRRLVECTNACALPGVALKYDNFIPVMWQAVARGFVKHEHACFVADGLRLGFTAGFDHSKMFGHRWFKNYPTATSDSAVPAVVDATLKRVAAGKTLDLGVWGGAASAAIKFWCKCSAIFPMGAVPKPLEPDALRPTDDPHGVQRCDRLVGAEALREHLQRDCCVPAAGLLHESVRRRCGVPYVAFASRRVALHVLQIL